MVSRPSTSQPVSALPAAFRRPRLADSKRPVQEPGRFSQNVRRRVMILKARPHGEIHSVRIACFCVIYRGCNSRRTAKVVLRRLDRDMAEEQLNLLQFASPARQRRAHVRRRSCGANLSLPILAANSLTTCQTSFSVTPSPQGFPALLTFPKSLPPRMPAATVQTQQESSCGAKALQSELDSRNLAAVS